MSRALPPSCRGPRAADGDGDGATGLKRPAGRRAGWSGHCWHRRQGYLCPAEPGGGALGCRGPCGRGPSGDGRVTFLRPSDAREQGSLRARRTPCREGWSEEAAGGAAPQGPHLVPQKGGCDHLVSQPGEGMAGPLREAGPSCHDGMRGALAVLVKPGGSQKGSLGPHMAAPHPGPHSALVDVMQQAHGWHPPAWLRSLPLPHRCDRRLRP